MDFQAFKQLILSADSNGTLMSAKHDPNQLSNIYTPYRSVLSHELAAQLTSFLNSENYSVAEYINTRYPLSPLYFTITPKPGSLTVAASGVTGTIASSILDTLVVVSGGTSGIHMYGEESSKILTMEETGILINKNEIKS
ncbi:hypothetical protein [Rufibacter ruber]|uniref:hypothetical protein n=1 Tax=Rufibacter ruber TaxID=1783499 RepID=UPI00128FE970|nr:hypothetical protein [Rufibacter ruber]